MLTEIYHDFATESDARKALTIIRKKYRVALRGAVVIGKPFWDGENRIVKGVAPYRIWAELGSTGFSSAELASVLDLEERNRV